MLLGRTGGWEGGGAGRREEERDEIDILIIYMYVNTCI